MQMSTLNLNRTLQYLTNIKTQHKKYIPHINKTKNNNSTITNLLKESILRNTTL